MALHRALWAAQGFLLRRTKELTKEHAKLSDEVEEQQARILYTMLRQRRRLPMKSQVSLLRRKQFSDCAYAKRLLASHRDDVALYRQLEALLPQTLAHELGAARPKVKEHLAAGGSDGRVHIVSSRLKNSVKKMQDDLRQAHDKIAKLLADGSVGSEEERREAEGAMSELEDVLRKAGATNDLKVQLDALYEAEGRLAKWTSKHGAA